jgi:hypothetical protein
VRRELRIGLTNPIVLARQEDDLMGYTITLIIDGHEICIGPYVLGLWHKLVDFRTESDLNQNRPEDVTLSWLASMFERISELHSQEWVKNALAIMYLCCIEAKADYHERTARDW